MEPSSGSSDRPLGTTRQVYLRQDGPPDYWREGARACFPGLNLDWLTDEPIQARLERCSFDDARVTEVVDSPVHIFRQRPRTSSGGYWLILQLEGNTRYLRADRTAVDELQHPGDLLLIDPGCPFEAVSPTPVRLLAWDVPAECLIPLLAAPEAGLRRVPRRAGVSAILGSFAQALMREADRLDALSQRSLKTHLCGLIALSLGATATARESRRDTCRAVRRQQALAYVEAHLRDYRLTVDRAAADLGMSRRWLYAIFDDRGTTFAAWVARRRVEECMKCLEDPAYDRFSITEIAFDHGFRDLSTFNRRFRSRYGMTPLDARRHRLQRVAP